MTSATIKLFFHAETRRAYALPKSLIGPAKLSLRPAPNLDELLAREELEKSGVYILIGRDPLYQCSPRHYR